MSPYEQLTKDPDRKCRPEVLLRLLLSTSYPQTILTDLTFLLAKHADINGEYVLNNIATSMQEIERSFTMFDFIRSVEVKRCGSEITMVIKCLDVDPTARTLNDSIDTHQVMATSWLTLSSADKSLNDVKGLAEKLLNVFYKSQVSFKNRLNTIQRTRWKHRTKATQLRKPIDTNIDYNVAVNYLVTSLEKNNFNIVLTQSSILLQDQRARLFNTSNK